MRGKMIRIFKISTVTTWLFICLIVAYLGISQSHGGNPEAGLAPAIIISILTAPSGLVAQIVLVFLIHLIGGSNVSIGLAGDILIYAAMIGAGYFQWFVLLPKGITRMKHERSLIAWGLVVVGLVAISYGLYRFYNHVFPTSM